MSPRGGPKTDCATCDFGGLLEDITKGAPAFESRPTRVELGLDILSENASKIYF